MIRTAFDHYHDRKVQARDGVEGQICLGCQKWVPVAEMFRILSNSSQPMGYFQSII